MHQNSRTRAAMAPALSADQQHAFDLIADHIAERRPQPFLLHGLAGTGKTTLLAEIARHYDCKLVAPTAKAASVLGAKLGRRAETIHGAIYRLKSEEIGKGGRRDLKFEISRSAGSMAHRLVLLDEASMVGVPVGRDLAGTGACIIACGDPGQLPPVGDAPYFAVPNYTLVEIHRQAAGSPIIRQAHRVRDGLDYEADGDAFRVVRGIADADLLAADMVLAWTNETRKAVNRRMRRLRGFSGHPKAGEPAICLRNCHARQVRNGETFTLVGDVEGYAPVFATAASGETVRVYATFAGFDRPSDAPGAETEFDFAYCITTHKAQGSEYPHVLILDEYPVADPAHSNWLYTAITRASERVTIARRAAR